MRFRSPGNFLPLAGGTMTGDIQMLLNRLRTTNLIFREENLNNFVIEDLTGVFRRGLRLGVVYMEGVLNIDSPGGSIAAFNADNQRILFTARDNGVGQVEVAALQNADDPYFQITLPMRLLPVATVALPAAPLEGMLTYDDTLKRLTYRDNTAWRTVQRVNDFVELFSAQSSPAGFGAFEDWNLSAIIPAGTILCEIEMFNAVAVQSLGVRTNGSALARSLQMASGQTVTILVKPDAARLVERSASTVAANAFFRVIGYWI